MLVAVLSSVAEPWNRIGTLKLSDLPDLAISARGISFTGRDGNETCSTLLELAEKGGIKTSSICIEDRVRHTIAWASEAVTLSVFDIEG